MPGSPPSRIMEPGTTPPPRTKSNSARSVVHRAASDPLTERSRGVATTLPPSPSVRAPPARRLDPVAGAGRAPVSSPSEVPAPHVSQRPAHLGWSAPPPVQGYAVFALA